MHHSDAGNQYTSLSFADALTQSGIAGLIGSVGDARDDDALMESAIGLYKTELVDGLSAHQSSAGRAELEPKTASWVNCHNAGRLHSSLNYQSPVDYEVRYRDDAASTREVA